MFTQEQVLGLRQSAIRCISRNLSAQSAESLSNQEIVNLLQLGLKHISNESLYQTFDEVLSERVAKSGISNKDFAQLMEVVADHN